MHGDVPQFGQGDNGLNVDGLPEDAQVGRLLGNAWGKVGNPRWMVKWSKGKREYLSLNYNPC